MGDKMDSESIDGEEIKENTVKQQWTLRWLLWPKNGRNRRPNL